MERKALTLRLTPKLYDALSTLSNVAHRSMNDLVSEAVRRFVVAESSVQARDLEKTLERLRAYNESDPDFEKAIAEFVQAEATHDDPLEGRIVDTKGPVRRKVEAMLTDG